VGALAELQPRRLPAVPGGIATAELRIRNNGSVVDQFDLSVLGDAGPWAAITPPSLSLFPGAEGTATVTFSPPRSPRVRAGAMTFGLRVQSKEDPAGSAVEEGTLDIEPFTDLTAELVPRTSRGSGGATHDLAVDNRGNTPISAVVEATDADRLLGFDIRPPAVTAEPGAAVFTKVRVQPQRRFLRGAAVSRPFQVQVVAPNAAPVVLDGSLLQTPILPPWTMRALLIGLALLIVAFVAWQGLVKPAIESTARQQAADVLAEAGISPLPSGGGGGGGGGGASPSPGGSTSPSASTDASTEPSTTPSTEPSGLPGAGGATPSDGRLVAGAAPLAPPPDKSLYVTDLVFSNPSDTVTGEIRLERSGQPLLVLRLENFRDLDFHFVTPILVAPGQELSLVCPTGCPGSAVYYSGFTR
jgi:hypothetical protein